MKAATAKWRQDKSREQKVQQHSTWPRVAALLVLKATNKQNSTKVETRNRWNIADISTAGDDRGRAHHSSQV
eukprot:1148315-Amphidinium_carterae.2